MTSLVLLLALQADPIEELGAQDPERRRQAEERLLALGSEAVPALKKALSSSDPEIAARAERLLAILSWDLPVPLRPTLGSRLADTPGMSAEERGRFFLEILAEDLKDDPDLLALVLAQAFDRETSAEHRANLGEAISQIPGGFARLVEWNLRRYPERHPLALVRQTGVPFRDAFGPLHHLLRSRGLADLATPAILQDALGEDATAIARKYEKLARLLEKSELPLEAALAWRRSLFLDSGNIAGLRELDRVSRAVPCVRDHVALLRWLKAYAPEEETRKEAATLEDGTVPDGDIPLAEGLRIPSWVRVRTARRGSGLETTVRESQGRVHVAFETWRESRTVVLDAYDPDTGDRLWSWTPPPQPRTEFELSDLTPGLQGTRKGLLFSYRVGAFDRTGLALLDPHGKPQWTREYDLWAHRLRLLPDDRFALIAPNGWYQTWFCRLSDGQLVGTAPDNEGVPDGRLHVTDSIPPTVTLFGDGGKKLWSRRYPIQKGVGTNQGVCGRDAIFLSVGWKVLAIAPKDGEILWEREVAADETVHHLLPFGDGVLLAVREGYTKWRLDHLSKGDLAWSAPSAYVPEGTAVPAFVRLTDSALLFGREVFDAKGRRLARLEESSALHALAEDSSAKEALLVSDDEAPLLSLRLDESWVARIRPILRSAPDRIVAVANDDLAVRFARDLDPYLEGK